MRLRWTNPNEGAMVHRSLPFGVMILLLPAFRRRLSPAARRPATA